jgi:cytoskeletal protein CcmA (bactofilin family)
MATGSETSILGPSTQVIGQVGGSGGLQLEGRVRGNVAVSGHAQVAAAGTLEGNLDAESVELAGTLRGEVTARGAIAIGDRARVRGTLRCARVSMQPGAQVAVRIENDAAVDARTAKR